MRDYKVVERILERATCVVACHSEDEQCLQKIQNAKFKMQNYGTVAEIHDAMRPDECAIESAQKLVAILQKIKKDAIVGDEIIFPLENKGDYGRIASQTAKHVSSPGELAVFLSAKQKGLPIYLEATPHHLFLDIQNSDQLGNFVRVNPPIRSASSRLSLQNALIEGFIDTIGSDHAPHTIDEKNRSYTDSPSGMPGIETILPLMLDFARLKKFTIQNLIRCMCENPARIFGIERRGAIRQGYFADIVIVDQDLTRVVETNRMYTKCGWSAFAGRSITGFPYATIVNGEIAFLRGRIVGNPAGRDVMARN